MKLLPPSFAFLALLALPAGTPPAGALTLEEGLAIVETQGWEGQIAAREAEAAGASARAVRSARLPRISARASQTWLAEQPEAVFEVGRAPVAETSSAGFSVTATQLVTDFGRTGAEVRAAREEALARSEVARRAVNGDALDFVLAYLSLLEAERLLQVSREEVRSFEAHLADAKARHEAAVVTVNDVLQAEVNLADARQRNARADGVLKVSASQVNLILRRPLLTPVDPAEPGPSPLGLPPSLDEAFGFASLNRGDLLALDRAVESAAARTDAEGARLYPALFVSGGFAYEENRYLAPESNWSLSAGISWDLYDGGARKASLDAARRKLDARRMERERLAEAIRMELRGSLVALATAKAQVQATEKAVEQGRESLRLQRAMYEEGEGTSTDVTDAVARLARTEQTYWSAVYGTRRQETLLLHAMGRDLSEAFSASGGGPATATALASGGE